MNKSKDEIRLSLAAKLWKAMPIAQRMKLIKSNPEVAKVVNALPPEQTLEFIKGNFDEGILMGDPEYMGIFPLLAALVPAVIKWGGAAIKGIKKVGGAVVGLAKKTTVSAPPPPPPKKGIDPKILMIGGGAVLALVLMTRK